MEMIINFYSEYIAWTNGLNAIHWLVISYNYSNKSMKRKADKNGYKHVNDITSTQMIS